MSEPMRNEGSRLLQAGDVDGAIRQFQQAVAINPADWQAQGYLGIALARKGDFAAGAAALQEAVRRNPADAGLRFNLALALFRAGQPAEARPHAEQALALNPAHTNARELLGRIDAAVGVAPAYGGLPQPPTGSPTPLSGSPVPPLSGSTAPPPGWGPTSAPQATPYLSGESAPPGWQPAPVPSESSRDAPGGAGFTAGADDTLEEAPAMGLRVLRGFGWGILYGQWWTLWTVISLFLWGGAGKLNPMILAVVVLGYAIAFGFLGSLAGLIIGAADADESSGAGIGIGVGVCALLIEMFLFKNPFQLINIFFYFFTGRFVGSGIGGRVQQPVLRRRR